LVEIFIDTLFDTFVPLDSFVYLRTTTKNIPFFKNYPMNFPIILVATGTVEMFFIDQKCTKETRATMVSKRVLSVFVCGAFICQAILMFFSMFFIK
jgi:hypothetical protein